MEHKNVLSAYEVPTNIDTTEKLHITKNNLKLFDAADEIVTNALTAATENKEEIGSVEVCVADDECLLKLFEAIGKDWKSVYKVSNDGKECPEYEIMLRNGVSERTGANNVWGVGFQNGIGRISRRMEDFAIFALKGDDVAFAYGPYGPGKIRVGRMPKAEFKEKFGKAYEAMFAKGKITAVFLPIADEEDAKSLASDAYYRHVNKTYQAFLYENRRVDLMVNGKRCVSELLKHNLKVGRIPIDKYGVDVRYYHMNDVNDGNDANNGAYICLSGKMIEHLGTRECIQKASEIKQGRAWTEAPEDEKKHSGIGSHDVYNALRTIIDVEPREYAKATELYDAVSNDKTHFIKTSAVFQEIRRLVDKEIGDEYRNLLKSRNEKREEAFKALAIASALKSEGYIVIRQARLPRQMCPAGSTQDRAVDIMAIKGPVSKTLMNKWERAKKEAKAQDVPPCIQSYTLKEQDLCTESIVQLREVKDSDVCVGMKEYSQAFDYADRLTHFWGVLPENIAICIVANKSLRDEFAHDRAVKLAASYYSFKSLDWEETIPKN